jgi:hypothetical protein
MKVVRGFLLCLCICALALTSGCGTRAIATMSGVNAAVSRERLGGPVPSVTPTTPVIAAVLAVPYDESPLSPRTVWIVGLDGHVTSRVVHVAPSTPLALSPDGRTLLHATGPPLYANNSQPPTGLWALDLDTGRDTALLKAPWVLSYCWDSSGRIVALTSTSRVAIRGFRVWHGTPGSLVSAVPKTTITSDASTLLASDGRTAYFTGMTAADGGSMSASVEHLWRYDFASDRMTLAMSIDQPGGPTDTPARSLVEPAYSGAPPYSWELPSTGLPFATSVPTSGGPRPDRIELLRYSDLKLERSIIPTPRGTAAYYPAPVFDSTFSHYLARTAANNGGLSAPSKLLEVDAATGSSTVVPWPADPLVNPVGYLGASRSFLFVADYPKGVEVVLQEPGKKPRVVLRIPGPSYPRQRWPGILGVQYAR